MRQRGRKSAAGLAVVKTEPSRDPPGPDATSPPAHLSPASRAWWSDVVETFELEPHHCILLRLAAEALDRSAEAREALAAHGSLTFTDDKGVIKTHPATIVERNATITFCRILRELDLDADAPFAPTTRPPRIRSNRG